MRLRKLPVIMSIKMLAHAWYVLNDCFSHLCLFLISSVSVLLARKGCCHRRREHRQFSLSR